ncbi:hypothetical protein F510_1424, partial [Anoxybacillus gonensis]
FTSHYVQIKLIIVGIKEGETNDFTSHYVQIKRFIVPISVNRVGNFTSHYVQIKPAADFQIFADRKNLYIPLRSDKTVLGIVCFCLMNSLYIPLRSDKTGNQRGAWADETLYIPLRSDKTQSQPILCHPLVKTLHPTTFR